MSEAIANEARAAGDIDLARTVLGGVLADLEASGSHADLAPTLERARARLYEVDAAADATAALAALEDAHRALVEARHAAVDGVGASDDLARLLPNLERLVLAAHDARVQREIARDRSRPAPPRLRPTFRAGTGVPVLHQLDRRVLPSSLAAASLPPLDDGLEEKLDDEDESDDEDAHQTAAADGRRRRLPLVGLPAEAGETRELSRLARDRLEEISVSSHLRRPTARHFWTVAAGYEARLIENLDALVVLGMGVYRIDVVDAALAYEREIQSLDVGRVFTRAMVVGCLAGTDAADVAVASMSSAHTTTRGAVTDALSLASNPDIARAARASLLREPDAPTVTALLEVLRRRGEADLPTVAPFLAHPSAAVRAEAIRGLARGGTKGGALARMLESLLDQHDDFTTRYALAESLAVRGSRKGAEAARLALGASRERGEVALWAHLLAVIGDLSDLDRLLEAGTRVPAAMPSLGWLGHPVAVPHLIDALARERHAPRSAGPERRPEEAALASALERILGAELVDPLLGDDRLGQADVAPTVDQERWRAYWSSRATSFEPPMKTRFGLPWRPRSALAELEDAASFPGDRAMAALELAVALGPDVWIDTLAWVARQEMMITAARDRRGELDADPGVAAASRPRAARS